MGLRLPQLRETAAIHRKTLLRREGVGRSGERMPVLQTRDVSVPFWARLRTIPTPIPALLHKVGKARAAAPSELPLVRQCANVVLIRRCPVYWKVDGPCRYPAPISALQRLFEQPGGRIGA